MDALVDLGFMLLVLTLAIVAFVPMIRLFQLKHIKQYKHLRRFSVMVVVWTVFTLLRYMLTVGSVLYYTHLLMYPTIFLLVLFGVKTIYAFMEKQFPRPVELGMIILAIFFFVISITNDYHLAMITIHLKDVTTYKDISNASANWAFYILIITTFSMIFYSVAHFLLYIKIHDKQHVYKTPARLFFIVAIVGFFVNFFHVFIYTFSLDPTYVTVVVFGYLLYHIVYKRDFNFALLIESRKALIGKMREMYILANEEGTIIELSPKLINDYHIDSDMPLDKALDSLKNQAIIYHDMDSLRDYSSDKPYLYTISKVFSPEGFRLSGTLMLLYDETKFIKTIELLNELRQKDQMTDLYNRDFFEQQVKTFENNHERFGVILVDLNGLKLINDYQGHKAGDDLIKRLAAILKDFETKYELNTYRLGGDEFILFSKDYEKVNLDKVVKDLLNRTDAPNILDKISIAVGNAKRRKNESFESTLTRADNRMYTMKNNAGKIDRNKIEEALKNAKKNT